MDANEFRVVLAVRSGRLIHHGDEQIARFRIDRRADRAVLARTGEDAGRIEVQQARGVYAHRAVAQDDLDRAVQLRDVEDWRVGGGERVRHERDVDRQLQSRGDALDDVAAVGDAPRRVGRASERGEVRGGIGVRGDE